MDKIANKMDVLVGTLEQVERDKEMQVAESDKLNHRVRKLELESFNTQNLIEQLVDEKRKLGSLGMT